MKEEVKNFTTAGAAGAAAGAATHSTIGGLGLAGLGTAIGLNLGSMLVIGGALTVTGYSLYRLGRRIGAKNVRA